MTDKGKASTSEDRWIKKVFPKKEAEIEVSDTGSVSVNPDAILKSENGRRQIEALKRIDRTFRRSRSVPRILILAGSHAEAEYCAEEHYLQPHEWEYLRSREQILGNYCSVVWYYGSYQTRTDLEAIERLLYTHMFSMTAPNERLRREAEALKHK